MTLKYERLYHTLLSGWQLYNPENSVGLSNPEVALTPPDKLRRLGREERVA